MAPRSTYVNSFLELAKGTETADNADGPAPFCWPEWRETISDEVVPWAKNAMPANTDLTWDTIYAIQAFAEGYYAAKGPAAVEAYLRSKAHAEGQELMEQYIKRRWSTWGLNSLIDEILRDNGITIVTLATPDLLGTYKMDETPVPGLYADIAARMFGADAFRPGGGNIKPPVMRFVKGLLVNCFNRYRQAVRREGERLESEMEKWKKAYRGFKELEGVQTTTLPVSAVKDYIRLTGVVLKRLTRWKDLKPELWEQ
ncbi:hypothetical protein BV20DRAFT_983990, partial [Pilatotrama ljubarskyi]